MNGEKICAGEIRIVKCDYKPTVEVVWTLEEIMRNGG